MGAATLWFGFLGGATGSDFAVSFRKLKIPFAPVPIAAPTRMNLELLEDSARITEILEPGSAPSKNELREMRHALALALQSCIRRPIVVISGSLPAGVAPAFYKSLVMVAKSAGSRVYLDTSGDALRAGLAARPAFVKPNKEEIEALLSRKLKTRSAILDAARELIAHGAESAAISLGAEGLVWLERWKGPAWLARPPRLGGSTVGCGDATVAGFALAALKGLSGWPAVSLATACGAANCLAKSPGRISPKDVHTLIPQVSITRIG